LTCLVTSRQRLGLSGEQEFALLPLPTPRSGVQDRRGQPALDSAGHEGLNAEQLNALLQYPSVQLFVDRARAVRPGFQLDEKNAAVIAALCDRLEGLPLGLELAAAWVRTLTPAQILERLSQ